MSTVLAGYNVEPPTGIITTTAGTLIGSMNNGDYKYKVTYVTLFGETTPSDASSTVTTISGSAELSNIPLSDNTEVSTKKIYRCHVNDTDGEFYHLVTVSGTVTSYIDAVNDSDLGDSQPLTNTASSRQLCNGTVAFASPIIYSTGTVTAAGSTLADATPLTTENIYITVPFDLNGVKLPIINENLLGQKFVINNTDPNNRLRIYPALDTEHIGVLSAGVPYVLAAANLITIISSSANAWSINIAETEIPASLLSISNLQTNGNELIYTQATNVYATTPISAAGRSLVSAQDQSSQQAIIGVEIGVDAQAHSDHLDSLTTIGGLNANQIVYTTGAGYSNSTISNYMRTNVLPATDAGAMITALGLGYLPTINGGVDLSGDILVGESTAQTLSNKTFDNTTTLALGTNATFAGLQFDANQSDTSDNNLLTIVDGTLRLVPPTITGDVFGTTDTISKSIVVFDDTTGKTLSKTNATIINDDLSGIANFTASGLVTCGDIHSTDATIDTLSSTDITSTTVSCNDVDCDNITAQTIVSGSVSATTLVGTISTSSQPNITSIGTLSTLFVSGLATFNDTVNINSDINLNNGANIPSGKFLTLVSAPVSSTDAANKSYVDSLATTGTSPLNAGNGATTTALAGSPAYSSSAGTLTATTTTTTLVVDGITYTVNDNKRLLVKDQADPRQNGVYTRTANSGGNWQLTRVTDFDSSAEAMRNTTIFISGGTVNINTSWTLYATVTQFNPSLATPGSSDVIWVQTSGSQNITPGNGLEQNGSIFNVVGTTDRITVTNHVDIASTYAGQNTIATLGTITSGVWNGTTLTPTYGGTGLSDPTADRVLITNGSSNMSLKANPSGAFVGTTDSQTISNKIIDSGRINTSSVVFANTNNTANTLSLNTSSMTAARTLNIPDLDDTITTLTAIQTLTNKTLTSPTVNNPTITSPIVSNGTYSSPIINTPTITNPTTTTGTFDTPSITTPSITGGTITSATLLSSTLTSNTNNILARGLWNNTGTNSVSTYAASNPTSGQVLTATSSTTATWQTPSTGGIPNTARSLFVYKTANNVSPNWSTLTAAITNAISLTPSSTSPILIQIYAGVYAEANPLTIPAYVTVASQTSAIGDVIIRPVAPAAASAMIITTGNACAHGFMVECADGSGGYAIIGVQSSGSSLLYDVLTFITVKNASAACFKVTGGGTKNSHIVVGKSCTAMVDIPGFTVAAGIDCSAGGVFTGVDVTITGFFVSGFSGVLTDGIYVRGDSSLVDINVLNISYCTNGARVGGGTTSNSQSEYSTLRASSTVIAFISGVSILMEEKSVVGLTGCRAEDNAGFYPNQLHLRINNPALPAEPNLLQMVGVIARSDKILFAGPGMSTNPARLIGVGLSDIPGETQNRCQGEFTVGSPIYPAEFASGEGDSYTIGMVSMIDDGGVFTNVTSRINSPVKDPIAVNAATTAAINLASAPATIDGVTPTSGITRVLVKNGSTINAGTTSVDNGVYVWNGAGAAMTRATDFAATSHRSYNTWFMVDSGTINYGSAWKIDATTITNNDTITVGTSTWGVTAWSTAIFPEVPVINDAFYIGNAGLVKFGGVLMSVIKPITTSSGSSTGVLIWEYWNGSAWTTLRIMSTLADAPYTNRADKSFAHGLSTTNPNMIRINIRFGNIASSWASSTINGVLAYWVRVRCTNTVLLTRIPTIARLKQHGNYTRIGTDGFVEYFGNARPRNNEAIQLNDWFSSGVTNEIPTSQRLIATASPVTISIVPTLNVFANAVYRSLTAVWIPPNEIDSANNLIIKISGSISTPAGGNIVWRLNYVFVTNEDVIGNTTGSPTAVGKTQVTSIVATPVTTRGKFTTSISADISGLDPTTQSVWISIARDGNNASDTATCDVYLHSATLSMVKWCNGEYYS